MQMNSNSRTTLQEWPLPRAIQIQQAKPQPNLQATHQASEMKLRASNTDSPKAVKAVRYVEISHISL